MDANIYKDALKTAHIFGTHIVLYTTDPVPREDVPEGWHCYDLQGTARNPDIPYALTDAAPEEKRLVSVLSPMPLKDARVKRRLVKDMFRMTGGSVTLAEFCKAGDIPCPETPLRHRLHPASPDESELFYALPQEKDAELSAIGHVRIDFGRSRTEFHHTWWPRGPEDLNTQKFRDELKQVVDDLRKGVLKSLGAMARYCRDHGGEIAGGTCCRNHGYVLETERYIYRLRCNPTPGDYQAYLSCFVKPERKLGLTETGLRQLRDAADPALPHSYDWYVMEDINTPEERFTDGLSLEDAVRRYAASERAGKRLGMTKDGIAAVDLLIRHDGREWVSDDWTKMDSFSKDPVIAEAVSMLRKTMDGQAAGQDEE